MREICRRLLLVLIWVPGSLMLLMTIGMTIQVLYAGSVSKDTTTDLYACAVCSAGTIFAHRLINWIFLKDEDRNPDE